MSQIPASFATDESICQTQGHVREVVFSLYSSQDCELTCSVGDTSLGGKSATSTTPPPVASRGSGMGSAFPLYASLRVGELKISWGRRGTEVSASRVYPETRERERTGSMTRKAGSSDESVDEAGAAAARRTRSLAWARLASLSSPMEPSWTSATVKALKEGGTTEGGMVRDSG